MSFLGEPRHPVAAEPECCFWSMAWCRVAWSFW